MNLLIRFSLYFALLTFYLFLSCSTDPEPPNIEPPPGYQEDIPWPSLADSPWPMFRADPQNTGRSRYAITNKNFAIVNSINTDRLMAGITLGTNSILFNTAGPSTLYSYDQNDLSKNWEELIGFETNTAPLVTNSHIFTTAQNILYAFNHTGDTIWTRRVIGRYVNQRTLNIDLEGNVYLVNEKTISKFTRNGDVLNELINPDISNWNTTAFSPDGSTLYLVGDNVALVAFDTKSFSNKWTFGDNGKSLHPVVDSYGNIYLLTFSSAGFSKLFSIDPKGLMNWQFTFYDKIDFISANLAIGKQGNIYFGSDTLYSVSYDGTLNWKTSIGSNNQNLFGQHITAITSDNTGNVMIGTADDRILMFSNDGNKENEIIITNGSGRGFLPIVISEETLYAPIYEGAGETGDIFVLK